MSLVLSIKVLKHKSLLGWNPRPCHVVDLMLGPAHSKCYTSLCSMLHTHHLRSLTLLWKTVTKTELSIITVNLMIVHEMIGSMVLMQE